MNTAVVLNDSRRRWLPLFWLTLLFAAPPLLGWLLFTHPQWLPASHSNVGLLIDPPLAVQAKLPEDLQRPLWRLLLICGPDCDQRMQALERMRSALARDRYRLQLARLDGDKSFGPLQELLTRHGIAQAANTLLLVDPLGQLMMRYDEQITDKGVLRDLQTLMKASGYWMEGDPYGKQ